jgi:Holliday junction resolvase
MGPQNAKAGAGNADLRNNDQLASSIIRENTDFEIQNQPVAKRGGRKSRDKGNRTERAIVKSLQDRGFAAERIPLSGAAGGSFVGDISVPVCGIDRVVEVKCRANGFRELYSWLESRDFLIVKADRKEALVVVRMSFAAEVAAKAGAR